ncbi:hypothetical protein SAMN05428949_2398 [Chitinophaga sp. YR627]|uniref:hypothetical protein n=1 Tax=Chitinophaga sp. YR627 TaxID=1881041 RepID=UPI0008E59ED2|nr:hypothetical protein [Chitinophaga sp. YR627]SFN31804.1 hypothetical protein SAMN05428949_2398 [Chitinophaga sp. YR627]
MLNENHSNSLPEKMDALDRLPGEAPFNKGAAWDRLQQRMETQTPVKRKMWYWWAAAAVLIAAMIPFLLQEKTAPALPAAPAVVYTPVKQPSPAPVAVVKTADVVNVVIPEKTPVVRISKQLTVQSDTSAGIQHVAIGQPIEEKIIVNNDTPLVMTTTTVSTNTHKMRVVHINEVGGDVIGNTYINPDHKQFRIAVGGRTGFASQIVSDKSSNNIPKN